MAHLTDLEVGEFIHSFGDAHIYENHFDAVDEQLKREPFRPPHLTLDKSIRTIDDLRPERVRLDGYQYHPALKGEVAV